MRSLILTLAALVVGVTAAVAQPAPQTVVGAVADPGRPATDRTADAHRRPAETLAFAGVTSGMSVGEYMPGAGYYTRILARAVGPDGRVLAYQPAEIVAMRPAYLTEIRAAAAEPGMQSVTVATGPTEDFSGPAPFDLVFTAQNYHDLYGPFASPGTGAAFDKAVFAALKPGGRYVVVDHSAPPGTGLAGAAALHRIDREAAIAAITAAGFVLEAGSDILANPADPRTVSVFDPSVRGRTDQFVLRFRKP